MNTKQLFKKVSIKELKKASLVNESGIPLQYAYIKGFFSAADTLVEIAIKTKDTNKKDFLFYPICFNYRHYLEIHLKSLIEVCGILYIKMDKIGYLPEGTTSLPDKDIVLNDTHSLYKLLELLQNRLVLITNEEFPKDIKKYIIQMHDTDKNGQKYRYPQSLNGQPHFKAEMLIDLTNLQVIMCEVKNMLFAIGSYLDHYEQISDNMIQEIESFY